MTANEVSQQQSLLGFTVSWLDARLPATWNVTRGERRVSAIGGAGQVDADIDSFIDVQAPNGTYATIAVEVRNAIQPRDVERLLPGVARSLRALAGHVPLLVVAPWISPRTRALLESAGFSYLDATGNASFKLDNPAVFLQAMGAQRDPSPAFRPSASLRGSRSARLIRTLADVMPPYGVSDLAVATGLTPGYVSRLLDALDRQAIVSRGHRGVVEQVEVAALLRAWASEQDLFRRRPETTLYVAPEGPDAAIQRLARTSVAAVVTGSFAAVRLAAVAAPAMLAVHCREPETVADALGLLPADAGANVALLRPLDDIAFARTSFSEGVEYAAPSQVCVDCLSGNGRMPAEGEAVLDWMLSNETRWRASSLHGLGAAE